MLKRKYVVPRDRPLIAIGYKYNTQKVLYFIAAEHIWELSVLCYHIIRVNYPYPFLGAIFG